MSDTTSMYQPTTTLVINVCAYCGLTHSTLCQRIREIEYHPNGLVKRVVLKD